MVEAVATANEWANDDLHRTRSVTDKADGIIERDGRPPGEPE